MEIEIEELVNLTPHEINLQVEMSNGDIASASIKPSGFVLRVKEEVENIGMVRPKKYFAFKLIRKRLSDISKEDLEKVKKILEEGKGIIVSLATAQKLVQLLPEYRNKIFIIGETIRDKQGRIVGAKSLAIL